ncbi:Uncharacterised protein [Vibrio cholerae]|nr:Uncharacterised protein [Vibrio cholerae]
MHFLFQALFQLMQIAAFIELAIAMIHRAISNF